MIWTKHVPKKCTTYPRLILDVDRYYENHKKVDICQQLRHVALQLISTAPSEFRTSNSILQFLKVTKYQDVVSESYRDVIDRVLEEKHPKGEI